MGDDQKRLEEFMARQVLKDCRRGYQRCHECRDWGCSDCINEDRPDIYLPCRHSGPRSRCRTCPDPICRYGAAAQRAEQERKEAKPPMSVGYRAACWFVGWLAVIVLLGLLWSGGPCGR